MTFEAIRPAINRSVLTLYRIFAIITLYAVLAGVLVFALIAAFYATSHSWIAPVIVSQTDKDTLDMTGKVLTTETTAEDLKLDIEKLEKTLMENRSHLAALEKLLPEINAALGRENQHKRETGPALRNLDDQKNNDTVRTQGMLTKLAEVDAMIDKELAAGLITKTDAIQSKMQFAKSTSDLTDSKIATVLLKDTILDKTVQTTTYLETLHKKAELESEIATLNIAIETTQKQIDLEKFQVEKFNDAIKTVKTTPYGMAMQSGRIALALVPYDNQQIVVSDEPVYDCYLSFVVCRPVGTLKATFNGEQHATHPIFRTDIRGFLVQLELTDPDSAKSKTLFLGNKPVLF